MQSHDLVPPDDAGSFVSAPIGMMDNEDGDACPPTPKLSNTAPGELTVQDSVQSLSVLTAPSPNHYSTPTGMVQCSVVERAHKLVLSYQLENGLEIPVLMAAKQKTMKVLPKYHIFDISANGDANAELDKNSDQFLGKLRRDKNIRIHGFSLARSGEDSAQVMYILYELPSLTSVILRREPPRRAQVAIYDEGTDVNGVGNRLAHMVSTSLKSTKHLDHVASEGSGLAAFANKEPYKKANGDLALNFNSRCRRACAANMQIAEASGDVLLQIAKWDKHKFHVDFKAPFNALQAFGFAIAQICDY